MALVEISTRAKILEGVNVLGDGSQLPSKMVDALEVIAAERQYTTDYLTESYNSNGGGGHDE